MNSINSKRLTSFILATLLITGVLALGVAAADQTASGTITAVGSSSFALEASDGATLEFVTDANTVVEGELKEGAKATVNYRTEDGKNIATRVRVTS